MAGFQVGEVCYPNLGLASVAYAVRFVPTAQSMSTAGCVGIPVLSATGTPGNISVAWARVAGNCTMPTAATFSAAIPQCAQYEIADAAIMAWGVAAVWISVFAVAVILKRAVQ